MCRQRTFALNRSANTILSAPCCAHLRPADTWLIHRHTCLRDHATNPRAGDCLCRHRIATFPDNWRYSVARWIRISWSVPLVSSHSPFSDKTSTSGYLFHERAKRGVIADTICRFFEELERIPQYGQGPEVRATNDAKAQASMPTRLLAASGKKPERRSQR